MLSHPLVVSLETAAFYRRLTWSHGKVVVTNGAFDMLHAGHIDHLEQSRALGDHLIVLVNSDISVQSNKGPSRPIIPEDQRAYCVASLECVSFAVLFDADIPMAEIKVLDPDILTKDEAYRGRHPEAEIVRRVIYTTGRITSTTDIIARCAEACR